MVHQQRPNGSRGLRRGVQMCTLQVGEAGAGFPQGLLQQGTWGGCCFLHWLMQEAGRQMQVQQPSWMGAATAG